MTADPVWVHEIGQIEMSRKQHASELMKVSTQWGIAPDRIILPRWGGAPFPFPPAPDKSRTQRVPNILHRAPTPILAHPAWWIIEEEWRRPVNDEDPRAWMIRTSTALETDGWIVDGATCGDTVLRLLGGQQRAPGDSIWDAVYRDAQNPTLEGVVSLPYDPQPAIENASALVERLDDNWRDQTETYRSLLWDDMLLRVAAASELAATPPPIRRNEIVEEINTLFDLLVAAGDTLGNSSMVGHKAEWAAQVKSLTGQDRVLGEAERRTREWLVSETQFMYAQAASFDAMDVMSLLEPDDRPSS